MKQPIHNSKGGKAQNTR